MFALTLHKFQNIFVALFPTTKILVTCQGLQIVRARQWIVESSSKYERAYRRISSVAQTDMSDGKASENGALIRR